jgi:hypothetical protein
MSGLPPSRPPSAAEQRLLGLLLLLRTADDAVDRSLIVSIMRRIRIQSAIREVMGVLEGITGAAGNVLRLLAGGRR